MTHGEFVTTYHKMNTVYLAALTKMKEACIACNHMAVEILDKECIKLKNEMMAFVKTHA